MWQDLGQHSKWASLSRAVASYSEAQVKAGEEELHTDLWVKHPGESSL